MQAIDSESAFDKAMQVGREWLVGTEDANRYRDDCGIKFQSPVEHYGYTTAKLLPELTGQPWNNLALSLVSGFQPTYIRVTAGEVTCDARGGRITVYLDPADNMTIRSIHQEITVLGGMGATVNAALRKQKADQAAALNQKENNQ